MLQKFRYPVTITSVLSALFLIFENLNIINLSDDTATVIINSIVSVLVMLGIAIAPNKEDEIEDSNTETVELENIVTDTNPDIETNLLKENEIIKESIEEIKEIIKENNETSEVKDQT